MHSDQGTAGERHTHGPGCSLHDAVIVRCLECELLFEAGIADSDGRSERCPQCGLQNSRPLDEPPGEGAFVIRHSSRFR